MRFERSTPTSALSSFGPISDVGLGDATLSSLLHLNSQSEVAFAVFGVVLFLHMAASSLATVPACGVESTWLGVLSLVPFRLNHIWPGLRGWEALSNFTDLYNF